MKLDISEIATAIEVGCGAIVREANDFHAVAHYAIGLAEAHAKDETNALRAELSRLRAESEAVSEYAEQNKRDCERLTAEVERLTAESVALMGCRDRLTRERDEHAAKRAEYAADARDYSRDSEGGEAMEPMTLEEALEKARREGAVEAEEVERDA